MTEASYIIFNSSTGEICGVVMSNRPPPTQVNRDYIAHQEAHPIVVNKLHRIDLATRLPVLLTENELVIRNVPKLDEAVRAIFLELSATLETQTPDYDQTLAQRLQWAAYRNNLRNLKNLTTAKDILNSWPTRPDGANPVATLKDRLAAAIAAGF